MLFRGWNRLCLQSASLSADEVASAATTAVARANRAAAMESEAAAADATAKAATATAAMVRAREESLRETCGVSAVLWKRVEASERTARKQERQAIVLVGDRPPFTIDLMKIRVGRFAGLPSFFMVSQSYRPVSI